MVIDMAHYAFLDSNNVVTEVIVGKNEGEDGIDWEHWYGEFRGQVCKRTSYHGNIRKNFAGIGHKYYADIDAFAAPQPYASWLLDANALWQPPVPIPSDNSLENRYTWDESNQTWVRQA